MIAHNCTNSNRVNVLPKMLIINEECFSTLSTRFYFKERSRRKQRSYAFEIEWYHAESHWVKLARLNPVLQWEEGSGPRYEVTERRKTAQLWHVYLEEEMEWAGLDLNSPSGSDYPAWERERKTETRGERDTAECVCVCVRASVEKMHSSWIGNCITNTSIIKTSCET